MCLCGSDSSSPPRRLSNGDTADAAIPAIWSSRSVGSTPVDSKRRCTKSGCERPAAATLTYSYADSTIVVGPISVYAEPHSYDLCAPHADTVNPPRGWEVLRLDYSAAQQAAGDDLLALADAVREPRARQHPPHNANSAEGGRLPSREAPAPMAPPEGDTGISRGNLRLLRD